MELSKITEEYAAELDLVLENLCKKAQEEKDSGRVLQPLETFAVDILYIQMKWLPNRGFSYVSDMCKELYTYRPRILITVGGEFDETARGVTPTAYTLDFLKQGGFKKIAIENAEKQKAENEKEKLNLEKLKYDLKNAKRVYHYTFYLSILAFIMSLILLILKIAGK